MVFSYLVLFIIIICVIKNSQTKNSNFRRDDLKKYFSNLQMVLNTSNITLYKGDKSGENFLIAVKYSSTPTSNLELAKVYEISEKFHIHNKILLSNENIASNPSLDKKLREYDIRVLNSSSFQKLINNSESLSVLETSDTSDDTCDIDESTSPIKYEKFNVHSILSFFRNKPDRL